MRSRHLRPPYPPINPGGPPAGLATSLVPTFVLALVLSLAGCQTAQPHQDLGNFTRVTLEAVGGEQCVKADPHYAEIWSQEVAGRPHQVHWIIESGTPYRWVIDFKGLEGEKDHFGQRVVPCRAPHQGVISGPPAQVRHAPGSQVKWTYRVTLESCEPGPVETVCESDPEVIILDVSR